MQNRKREDYSNCKNYYFKLINSCNLLNHRVSSLLSYVNNTTRKTKEPIIDLRLRIINFHKSGNSYFINSNRLAIPRSTVQSVIKNFKQFGMTENLPGYGRKAKLSPRTA